MIVKLFIIPIKFYRYFISPLFPPSCRFQPTCSEYAIDIIKESRALKLKYSEYSQGLNINFCEISDSDIRLRTYERGVENETLSCGTGAVASAIFLKDSGFTDSNKIKILMKGGTLCINFRKEQTVYSEVWLSGAVNMVFKGVYNTFD